MTTSRSATIAKGLAALTGILVILLAVPAALALFGGNPFEALPSNLDGAWDALTRPDDGRLLIAVLTIAGWAVWASLAASLLVEIPAALRGVPAPRLPGLSWQQGRAAAMTGAVAAMLALGGAGAATAAPTTHAPAVTQATTQAHAQDATRPSTPATTSDQQRSVTVQDGDTLWGIAEDELGDGHRYTDIAQANRAQINDPDLIQPGWELTLPGTTATASSPRESTPKPVPQQEQEWPASTTTPDPSGQADSAHGAVPPAISSTAGEARPSPTHSPSSGAPTTTAAPAADPAPAAAVDGDRMPIAPVIGIGALACAGLVTLLARRRRQQDRHRAPGRRIARPAGAAADLERTIREAADPLGVDALDQALRSLGHGASIGAHALPTLRAARLLPERIELYTVEEHTDLLPAPWMRTDQADGGGVADPGTWVLLRRDLDSLAGTDHLPAPWPALVTVGIDEQHAHVLLNLEQIGTLAITGDPATATAVVAGLGIELITSRWCDDAQITLVDVMPELVSALGNERVVHATDIDHVLAGLEHSGEVHRSAFTREGVDDAAAARTKGVVDEAWTPHLILTGETLTGEQADRLRSVVETTPRLAVAAITSGTAPTSPWVLEVSPGRDALPSASLSPTGMRLVPQHLTRQAYLAQLDLFDTTTHEDVPGPDWAENISDGTPFDLEDLPQPEVLALPNQTSHAPDVDEPLKPVDAEPSTPEYVVTGDGGYNTPVPLSASSWVTSHTTHDNQGSPASTATETPAQSTPGDTEAPDAAAQTAADSATGQTASDDRGVRSLPGATGPVVRVLGKVEIIGARGPRPASHRRTTELVTFLTMHPGGDEKVFSGAIFPGEALGAKLSHKRQTYMNTARRWLGRDDEGRPFVVEVDADGYRVTGDVTLDWHRMRDLIGSDIAQTSDDALHEALSLVTETPFTGIDQSRWEWAQDDIAEVCATVADVAHELSTRALRAGDSRTATWAAEKGLLAEPVSETLWRDLITAAWSSGIPGRARDTIESARAALEPLGDDLEDETVQLINDVIAQERRHA